MKTTNYLILDTKEGSNILLNIFVFLLLVIVPLLTMYVCVRDISLVISEPSSRLFTIQIILSSIIKLFIAIYGIRVGLKIFRHREITYKDINRYLIFIVLSPSHVMLPFLLFSLTNSDQLVGNLYILFKTQVTPTLFAIFWFVYFLKLQKNIEK